MPKSESGPEAAKAEAKMRHPVVAVKDLRLELLASRAVLAMLCVLGLAQLQSVVLVSLLWSLSHLQVPFQENSDIQAARVHLTAKKPVRVTWNSFSSFARAWLRLAQRRARRDTSNRRRESRQLATGAMAA